MANVFPFRAPWRSRPGPWSKPRFAREPNWHGPPVRRRKRAKGIALFLGSFALGGFIAFALANHDRASIAAVIATIENAAPSFVQQDSAFASARYTVVDGDTVRVDGQIYRLVGFNTPETGRNAQCENEQALGMKATQRLRQLVAGGGIDLDRVPCACRSGSEGTQACNYGRLCGILKVGGRDVGSILIAEGLAREYVCGATGCPRRESWCG